MIDRRRLLAHSDDLLDELERQALDYPRRRRVPDDLWERLEDLRGHLDYYMRTPETIREAHRWLLRLQGARLMRGAHDHARAAVHRTPAGSWKYLGLPERVDAPDWPERASDLLERLLDRWSWATTWARRRPSPATLTAARAAWDNYTTARAEFERLGGTA